MGTPLQVKANQTVKDREMTLATIPSSAAASKTTARRTMSTPATLMVTLAGVFLTALIMAVVSWMSVSSSQGAIDAIGRQAVPAIVNIQEVRARLVEMDANAANEFLGGGQSSRDKYEVARQRLSALLAEAGSSSALGANERAEIARMTEQVQVYSGQIETARANSRQGFPVSSAYLRFASNLMHSDLMPAADRLDKFYSDYLEAQYAHQSSVHTVTLVAAMAAALALLAVLGFGQVFLSKRMHRSVNPALAAATVLIVAFSCMLGIGLMRSSSFLAEAKEKDFAALHGLWQARALAYDAKGDQSLYLVMRGNGAKYETGFADKTKLLEGKLSEATAVVSADISEAAASARANLQPSFAAFVKVADNIRALDKGGDRQKAVETATGSGADQSNGSFARFDTSMAAVVDGQKAHFDNLVERAAGSIAWLNSAGLIVALMAVFMTWIGLRPRLNEYRV